MASEGDRPGDEVLPNLPSTRPQRRSAKRAGPQARQTGAKRSGTAGAKRTGSAKRAPGAGTTTARSTRARTAKRAPAARTTTSRSPGARTAKAPPRGPIIPRGASTGDRPDPPPAPPDGGELVGGALRAATELAQAGLTLGTAVARRALSRLPRP